MTIFNRIVRLATFAFPVWVVAASLVALYEPGVFTWFGGDLITWGLSLIMLSMGLTLEVSDFRRVARRPGVIAIGVGLQYLVMPLLGWTVAWAVGLPTPFAVGLILVSCCPGGVASNVISYLAMADVPLSVSLTAVSTSISVIMTPVLTTLYASSRVEVPATGLLLSTLQVVVVPILVGLALRQFAPGLSRTVLPVAPLVAVVLITFIVASIIGSSRAAILDSGLQLVGAVFLLHSLGFLVGYGLARVLSSDVIASRTVSIEVGMQNSGLGVVLAGENFPDPLVAVPSAISSLFHSVIASVLAAVWRATRSRHPSQGGSNSPGSPEDRERDRAPRGS